MGRSATNAIVTAIGALFVALLALAVVGTIAAIVFGVVAAIVSLVVTAAVVAVGLLALIGLGSLLVGGRGEERSERDASRTRSDTNGYASSGRTGGTRSWRDRLSAIEFGSRSRDDGRPFDIDIDRSTRADADSIDVDETAARLRERYVAGDVNEDEFERQMERLFETSELEERLNGATEGRTREWTNGGVERRGRDRLRE